MTATTMNPDLQRERSTATFSTERITNLLDGGADRTHRRRQLEAVIARDPSGVFSNDDNYYLHRTDRHVRSLAKHVRLVELCRKLGIGDECDGDIIASNDFPLLLNAIADDLPTSLHWVMFVPNIKSLCDEEQQKKWLPLCRDWRMVGCYAQTELGHGSNVRALETTATFVPESKGGMKGGSWIINSPTLTSYKFWPGTLGRTANHAMVIANLIDGKGINRGVHNFLVPLRSMKDHSFLPGVTTGDIGPKIGYQVMDNGFAAFDNVRVPRRNMAMRFAAVDEQGVYTKKNRSDAAAKVTYITMMQVRAYICNEASKNLALACTISIRYSAVRRQGFAEDGKKELQILDYKQQQHRLFPRLAASYCFFFSGRKLLATLKDVESRLISGKPVTKAEVTDLHASSSGLKSYTTTVAADGMEDCRKACGGHGFLQSSGLPELVTTYLQSPTVEGDNHMLPQQVVKVLLKLVEAVQGGEEISDYKPCDSYGLVPSLSSILHGGAKESYNCVSSDQVMNLPAVLKAFCHRASRLLVECASQLQQSVSKGKSVQEAWNLCLVQMARTSRAYSQYLLLRDFVDGVKEESANGVMKAPEAAVLRDLARLLALYWMEGEMGDFMEDGFVTAEQSRWIRRGVLTLLDEIRPNAVALVDARDFSDFRLRSAIGRKDGNVYEAIMEAARRDPLNKGDVGPGYHEHLKKLYVGGIGDYTGTASRL
eukprot:CAMPEP_0168738284 /NCGR_PEP_ID=MMETSP0724-20121128/10849_1 /TAXON_ID=265536 /ORGANISM="Amphiprora sp., Strain CCMP467" /LENGTH=710 /DNA_ID=CAMNT_0008785613 /DNA_START=10 /DNA_END=2142 /DNA_ORIENTATION=-